MQTIVQRPNDLMLALLRDGHDLPLTTIKHKRINIANWHITFYIIGESHRVRVLHGDDFVLEEMLACVRVPDDVVLSSYSFTDLHPQRIERDGYEVCVSFSLVRDAQMPVRVAGQVLEHHFPQTYGQTPVTRIQWQYDDTILRWWTLHTYAAAHTTTYVYSASRLHLN